MKFPNFIINSKIMTVYLPKDKIDKNGSHCEKILSIEKVTLREFTSLIGKLTSTYQAVLPAPLQYRGLQLHELEAILEG